jgi:aspartate ammonia-lyase
VSTRTEHDLLGSLVVPADSPWGIHTARACQNFRLTGQPVHVEWVRALAVVKRACALANVRTGYLDAAVGEAIVWACLEVEAGRHDDDFPVDALQGGAGTSLNLNGCEVIANLAAVRLGGRAGDHHLCHPLDHVNLSQSTNDVVPTALRVAATRMLRRAAAAFAELQAALQEKEQEFAAVLKVGRTEMQDAVPMTLGQEVSAWAQAIQRDWWRLYKAEERVRQVNLGGTAIGTGLNADRAYTHCVVEILRELTGLGVARAENLVDATQNLDTLVEVSGLLKAAAVDLNKIASDLRLLSSGPRAGLGEVRLPELQAGSSIMPGKVNPVATEAVTQVAYQVMACDLAVTLAAAHGQLELNAFVPLLGHNLLLALQLLEGAALLLARRCVGGLQADVARCRQLLEASAGMVTALSPYVGYQEASLVAREAQERGVTIREVALARGLFSEADLDRILAPEAMTRPGIAGLDGGTRR